MTETVAQQRGKAGQFLSGNTVGFQPGQSGNPKGNPKKAHSITMHLRDELAKIGKSGKTKAQEIAEGMVAAAMFPVSTSGSPKVLGDVLERTEGKVTQPIGGDGKPIIIRVIYDTKETDATE